MKHSLRDRHTRSLALSALLFELFLMTCFISVNAHAFFIGPVEIQVVDSAQSPLPSYHHGGQHFIMGRYNQRYMLRVINHSAKRYELVMTVDGRDVVNGAPGSFAHRGYVVDPHHSFNVEGFRKSSSSVAAFRFTTPGDSYAGRIGAGENVGVIGVALFSERERLSAYTGYRYRESARGGRSSGYGELEAVAEDSLAPRSQEAPAAVGQPSRRGNRVRSRRRVTPKKSELGTRYGESVHSSIEETQFTRRSSSPDQTLVIIYDSESGLRRRGVISPIRPIKPQPRAFPNESRFAPPPPGD